MEEQIKEVLLSAVVITTIISIIGQIIGKRIPEGKSKIEKSADEANTVERWSQAYEHLQDILSSQSKRIDDLEKELLEREAYYKKQIDIQSKQINTQSKEIQRLREEIKKWEKKYSHEISTKESK